MLGKPNAPARSSACKVEYTLLSTTALIDAPTPRLQKCRAFGSLQAIICTSFRRGPNLDALNDRLPI